MRNNKYLKCYRHTQPHKHVHMYFRRGQTWHDPPPYCRGELFYSFGTLCERIFLRWIDLFTTVEVKFVAKKNIFDTLHWSMNFRYLSFNFFPQNFQIHFRFFFHHSPSISNGGYIHKYMNSLASCPQQTLNVTHEKSYFQ